ncbi:MAG: phosphatidylcholine/phosphatidylserine synthase [Rhodovibrionaceae bacterium]
MAEKRKGFMAGRSVNWIVPNAMTLVGLCAGITGIRYAIDEQWERSVIAIAVAAVIDGLDGRVARGLRVASRFGAELDSLSDFVCFGVAPALIVYYWSLQDAGGLGWAFALCFAVCCAIRLARFNTELDPDAADEKPEWAKRFFTGVPAPAGGGLALLPLIFSLQLEEGGFAHPVICSLTLIGVSALMVSRLPTYSLKRLRVPGPYILFVLIGIGAVIAFLISTPWMTLGIAGLIYLGSIPLAWQSYRKLQKNPPPAPHHDEDEEEG